MISVKRDYRSDEEVNDLLHKVEKEDRLFEYKIDGWSIWRILRFQVAFDLISFPGFSSQPVSFFRKLTMLLGVARDIWQIMFLKKKKFFFKTLSSSQLEWEDGKLIDIYTDPLIEIIGPSFKLENFLASGKRPTKRSIAFPSNASTTPIEIFAGLLSRFVYKREWREIAEKISSSITTKLCLKKYTPRKILKEIAYFQYSKYFYRTLLKRINPSFVFVSNDEEFPLLAASKELKIKFVGMMHGILTLNDPPSLSSSEVQYRKSILVPDKIFVYGDYWKNQLKAEGFYQEELETTGSIRVDKYRSIRESYFKNKRSNDRCNILITTQGIDVPKLIKFLQETVWQLPKEKFNFIFKLHPRYDKSKQRYLEAFQNDSNVTILLGNEEPSTFALLAKADFHISISSACHFDAIGIGVPTIILPLARYEIVSELARKKHAFLCKTPKELARTIRLKNANPLTQGTREYYCSPGAQDRIKKILMELNLH